MRSQEQRHIHAKESLQLVSLLKNRDAAPKILGDVVFLYSFARE